MNVVDAPVMQVLKGAAGAFLRFWTSLCFMQRRWFATAHVGRALCTGTGPGVDPRH